MSPRRLLRIPSRVSLVIAALLLAGCSQAPAEPQSTIDGGIEGLVLDEALRPIPGAIVRTSDGNAAASVADDGSYRLHLNVSAATIVVEAPGFTSASRAMDLKVGTWIETDFRLQALVDDRYTDTQRFQGLIQCGAIVQAEHSHGNGDPDDDERIMCPGTDERNNRFTYIPDDDPADLLIELFWNANNERAEVLTLVLREPDGTLVHFEEGTSPLRLELAALKTQRHFELHDTAIIEVLPGIPEKAIGDVFVGLHIDQRFELYATSFHGKTQPIHWTVDQ